MISFHHYETSKALKQTDTTSSGTCFSRHWLIKRELQSSANLQKEEEQVKPYDVGHTMICALPQHTRYLSTFTDNVAILSIFLSIISVMCAGEHESN